MGHSAAPMEPMALPSARSVKVCTVPNTLGLSGEVLAFMMELPEVRPVTSVPL